MMHSCPHCLSYRIRPQPYRWYELPLLLVLIQPYHCRRCGRRFLRFRPPDLPNLRSRRTLVLK